MNRRHFLFCAGGSLAVGALGACGAPEPAEAKTFVLVPGTWHGGWVWKDVRRILCREGHQVYTPTPTGVGERSHLLTPEVDLYTHITDIANVIIWEELDDVILVGHSFSGLTITGVADRLRDRIRRIVFLDALVPRPGVMKAWPDADDDGRYPEKWQQRMDRFVDGYKMDFFAEYPPEMLVPANDEENTARLERLLTYHPWKQWSTELVLDHGGWEGLPRTYIRCVGQKYKPSTEFMPGPALTDPEWQVIELDVPRDGMMTDPQMVADCLGALV
jgi:pimeloyl-ACP methyl ester carboxylesterase